MRVSLSGVPEAIDTLKRTKNFRAWSLKAAAQVAFDYAKKEVGQHTKPGITSGALKDSLHSRKRGEEWVVEHDLEVAPHALPVHWGAVAHWIAPKDRKALRWPVTPGNRPPTAKGRGGWAFSKGHMHPGYEGDPWLVRAMDEAISKADKIEDSIAEKW